MKSFSASYWSDGKFPCEHSSQLLTQIEKIYMAYFFWTSQFHTETANFWAQVVETPVNVNPGLKVGIGWWCFVWGDWFAIFSTELIYQLFNPRTP